MRVLLALVGCVIVAAVAVALLLMRPKDPSPSPSSPVEFPTANRALGETAVLPLFGSAIPDKKNALWCASFQLAWDHLKSDVIKEPVLVAGAEQLSSSLNEKPFPAGVLNDGSSYATAGMAQDGIGKIIKDEMARRFPGQSIETEGLEDSGVVAFAFLKAGVKFEVPYFQSAEPLSFQDGSGGNSKVQSFGIREKDKFAYKRLRDQITVLFSESMEGVQKEFALDLCATSTPYQLILSKIPKKESLAATWEAVRTKMAGAVGRTITRFGTNEVLLVPDIRLSTTHHFQELEGRTLKNAAFPNTTIRTASQTIRFSLDRSGAELTSEARIVTEPVPRQFVLNGPFLVVICNRKMGTPLFALWVQHPEILIAWK